MKVALVSLSRRGGMVHFLVQLSTALAPLCDIVVVCSSEAELEYLPADVEILRFRVGKGPLANVWHAVNPLSWYALWKWLASLDIDLIHITAVHELHPAVAAMGRLLGKPIVYTVHDATPHPGAPLTIRLADRCTLRNANQAVAMTSSGEAALKKRGVGSEKISVIAHPAYTMFKRFIRRPAKQGRSILFLGRLEPYKGLGILLSAYQRVRGRLRGWKLIIAGSGSLPRKATRDLGPDVQIENRYLTDHEVAQMVSAASIIALPYLSATQSGVIALAQAFERPVIASDVGGLREMLDNGRSGILVPPGDVEALADGLVNLAGDEQLRARLQRRAAPGPRRPWYPANVAKAHLELYRRILRGVPG